MPRVELPRPSLMLVTDRHAVAEGALVHVVTEAVEGGVNLVQLREKDLPRQSCLNWAQSCSAPLQAERCSSSTTGRTWRTRWMQTACSFRRMASA